MPKKNKKKKVKVFKAFFIAFIITCFILAGAGAGLLVSWLKDTPPFDPEQLKPSETSFVFDSSNKQIAELHAEENRVIVPLEKIPEHLQNAFIAIEDKQFYNHPGINIKAILAALYTDMIHGEFKRGASTITQQLVKNAFLHPEKTIKRKLQEAWLSIQIERKYTKKEILEFYLNQIYFGHSANGVEAASKIFFGKHVWDLNLAESAMLAGITRNPGIYSPYINFKNAKARQEVVLDEMVESGFISKEEAEIAKNMEIKLAGIKNAKPSYKAPYFVDHVIRQSVDILKQKYNISDDEAFNKLYHGGLRIFTTVDMKLQQAAEKVLEDPKNYPESKPDKKGIPQPQAAIAVIDHRTGEIKALVGGRKHENKLGLNRATQSYRQPGSSFKPIAVYTPAIALGMTPATVIDNAPIAYPQPDGSVWPPENYNGRFDGLTTIRRAIELSVNVVAVKVLDKIGIDRGIEYAQKLGIHSLVLKGRRNDKGLSALALGGLTKGVTPLEMASAYGTLANKGIHIEPFAVSKITDKNGRLIYEHTPQKWVAVSEQVAYIMTDMLRGVVKRGTAWRLASLDFPVAGKTGTTTDSKDIWFVGYTPHLTAAVWMGYDEPTPMKNVAGGKQPALIWKQVIEVAYKDLPKDEDFIKPDKIIGPINVCAQSGKLPTDLCAKDPRGSQVIQEIFIKGTEPHEYCDVHVELEVCSDTNLLATEHCPLDKVKKKVFIKRKEPYVPAEDGRIPVDAKYEVPLEYCNIHGPQNPKNPSGF
ncbi:MAG: penicillin-binding protein [Thermosediminibacterales bacterium]|nr:penicillin-binding protein [Thermosediminibacterales bacterium]